MHARSAASVKSCASRRSSASTNCGIDNVASVTLHETSNCDELESNISRLCIHLHSPTGLRSFSASDDATFRSLRGAEGYANIDADVCNGSEISVLLVNVDFDTQAVSAMSI